jgi:hypothetical protein
MNEKELNDLKTNSSEINKTLTINDIHKTFFFVVVPVSVWIYALKTNE